MTTEPLTKEGPFPDNINCPLHAQALSEIKKIVLETRNDVRGLTSMDGPIARLNHKVATVETSVGQAHLEITSAKNEIKKVKEALRDREVPDGRQAVPGAKRAERDKAPDPPRDLQVQRRRVVRIEVEVHALCPSVIGQYSHEHRFVKSKGKREVPVGFGGNPRVG